MTIDLGSFAAAVPGPVVDRIAGARRVLAISHENPDADTIGASLAVCRLVEAQGGTGVPLCSDPIPALYEFIPGTDRFLADPPAGFEPDLLVVSDCGTLDRVGAIGLRNAGLFERLPRVVLDHHLSNDGRGEADWIDPAAAATCEMATLLAVRLGVPLDAGDGALGAALIAGIVMDTATFAHPNATPRTLAVTAALVEAGAPLSDTSRRLYRTKPDAQLQLFGRVLARLATSADGLVTWSSLLSADFAATGTRAEHGEGIIDLLSQSDRAEVVILFKEADGTTRVSVRTKPGGVDATVLTGRFGGGGHARAAGATIELPIDDAKPVVLAEAEALAAAVHR